MSFPRSEKFCIGNNMEKQKIIGSKDLNIEVG